MVIDTSAIIAWLKQEPERERIVAALETNKVCRLSAVSFLEVHIVVRAREHHTMLGKLQRFLGEINADEGAIKNWLHHGHHGCRGRDFKFSNFAIETALMLKVLFRLPLRSLEGFINSLFQLMDVPLCSPDYSSISNRCKCVEIKYRPPSKGAVTHLVIDATGLKVFGAAGSDQIQIQANTPLSPDDSAIQQHNQQNLGNSRQHGEEMVKNLSKSAEDKARSDLLHFLPEHSWASSIFGSMKKSKDWLCRRRDHLGDALFSGSRNSAHTFNHFMEQLSTLTPEQREQFITATKNGDRKLQQTAGGKLASVAIKLGNNFIGAAAT